MSIFETKIKEKENKNKIEDLVYKINYNIDNICNIIPSCIGNLKKLSENGFRDIVLIGLKIILKEQYNPTPETFNSNGKCDMYIKLNKEITYISEFKIWSGKNIINKTFQQLFEYLNWQSESSIIFLNTKNKNYENINKEIKEWIDEEVQNNKCRIFNEEKNQWFIEYTDSTRERKYKIYLACYDFYSK
ncbi:hypothetical protein [Candidatus Phytoplasma fraxini]|uniref:Uncharacterized protein n=1 Tax=Ash yellows phytoplasma TaxID=35780 RepID=A0ABZ2U7Q5_ASHYP